MHNTPHNLHVAEAKVRRAAHEHNLIEVSQRSKLEREAESKKNHHPVVHQSHKPESHAVPSIHPKAELPMSFEKYSNRRFFNSATHLIK